MAAVTGMAAVLAWHAITSLANLLLMLLCSLFVALAIEPPVNWLVRRRWRRGAATGAVMVAVGLAMAGVVAAFGQMFVSQVFELAARIPALYDKVADWLNNQFHLDVPDQGTAVANLVQGWGSSLAGRALSAGSAVMSGLVFGLGMMLIVYYLVAMGPQFRATICAPLPATQQRVVLKLWAIAQDKIAGYISSRVVLAALSAAATFIFLTILGVPSALPLGVFTGLVSQFVPTVGTYIGGAAPVLIALLSSPAKGLGVLIFIVAYQQVENLLFAPKISAKTMEINPAVAFVSVIGVGALMGPLGAFLALPLVATAQAIISTYIRRYDLVEDDLLTQDPPPPQE
ncbi:MAG: AI-2E family transporter [Bifidobacteriaceae bacterium]|jgi:predicted PurR-regulated permease PerM|nr:AI-2E family transporter [Bifidobacteriaceae bacterium]